CIRLEHALVSYRVRILLDVKRGLPAQQRISAAKAGTARSNTRILLSLELGATTANERRLLACV
ncbi:hypothetical protein NL495_27455, partial [Klebsiella pneumoniae]|nr:hypothetical protein [Klebsiella pneumoniae]